MGIILYPSSKALYYRVWSKFLLNQRVLFGNTSSSERLLSAPSFSCLEVSGYCQVKRRKRNLHRLNMCDFAISGTEYCWLSSNNLSKNIFRSNMVSGSTGECSGITFSFYIIHGFKVFYLLLTLGQAPQASWRDVLRRAHIAFVMVLTHMCTPTLITREHQR